MRFSVHDIVRRNSRTREPRPTGWQPVLARLPNVRAVLFDVYGTLFVSSAHNIHALERTAAGAAFLEALESVGVDCRCPGSVGVQRLAATMRGVHEAAHRRGNRHPEVDIQEIWKLTLTSLANEGALAHGNFDAEQIRQLAVEFECRTNPVWPMPYAAWCLKTLREAGIRLGLLSNAQFFTRELFPALLGTTVAELGFAPELQFYSYEHCTAKPGIRMHIAARAALARMRIRPAETLCIGNDMANDVVPAARLGFRTALFAGDQRSLRWGDGPERSDFGPDIVLTDLAQLPPCVTRIGPATRDSLPWHNPLWGMCAGRVQFYR
jgi:putative hydrolase of the HAD superfamily